MALFNFDYHLSGGAANANPSLSIGGVRSSQVVRSATVDTPTPMTGITILDVVGSPNGTGKLSYLAPYDMFWRPPQSESYPQRYNVPTSDNEEAAFYNLPSGFEYLHIKTQKSLLPTTGLYEFDIEVTNIPNNIFGDITQAELISGAPIYRCLYVRATGSMLNCRLFVTQDAVSGDSIQVALDPSATNGTAIQLVDQYDSTNLLSGLVFKEAVTIGDALVLPNLSSSQHRAVWFKYIIDDTVLKPIKLAQPNIVVAYSEWA